MICSKCGKEVSDGAVSCGWCGESTGSVPATATAPPLTTGYASQPVGASGPVLNAEGVPVEIAGKLNWGAFLLGPIWSIAHSTWIGLLCLLPYVGIVMSIVLLIKGNEWGWKNRQFSSVQDFNDCQKVWTKWGVAVFICGVVLGIIGGCLAAVIGISTAGGMR